MRAPQNKNGAFEKVLFVRADEKLTAFVELEAAIRFV
jgi:hypothetical protein